MMRRPPVAMIDTLHTPRLLLRRWTTADRDALAALNADPRVMAWLGGPLSRADSDAMFDRLEAHFAAHGFGLWAVELPGRAACAGFIGLTIPRFEAHFTPCVEVGWRLFPAWWGQGLATEGARAALAAGFTTFGLPEIVAMTVPANTPSRAVMSRLGMTRNAADDFEHPFLRTGDPLRTHVLYRLTRAEWMRAAGPALPAA